MEKAIFAMGCFWGPEEKFSKLNGVKNTEVGYCGGNIAQTTYKEVTGSITVPYNEYTRQLVSSMFDQDSFEFRILFEIDGSSIKLTLPEVCIIGDSLADIPAGEMTLPINFGAYASKSGNNYSQAISPFKIAVVD